MAIKIDELVNALPLDDGGQETPQQALQQLLQKLSHKTVPVGAFNRLWILGTLQAKIAAAYLFHWLRSSFAGEDEKVHLKSETNLKAALKLLGGMSYLRGAIMKVGQVLANYPDVVPDEFADVFGRLHFEAPPMHFSLLRELFRKEIGSNPEEVFDDFETEAFAAASLGQVHRARLKGTGQKVAVKIQYPNIARTIRDDFRNMQALIFPVRLHPDWDNLKEQFEEIRRMLDLEVDYENEARNMEIAVNAFAEDEQVVVPKVYPELSTRRVLTMDFIEGVHLDKYLASNPSQEERDRYGALMIFSSFRLSYGKKLLHADPHPGNYFFMPDGRMGLIDFGCCTNYTEDDIDYMIQAERAAQGSEEELDAALVRAADLTPRQASDDKRMHCLREYTHWVWQPMLHQGPFDFGDPAYFRRGVELYGELLKHRYVRSLPVNTFLFKCMVGIRALLTRLEARVDMNAIWKRETYIH